MRKIVSFILVFICFVTLLVPAAGAAEADLQTLVNESARYMLSAVPNPGFADVGGEWAVLGLARSGYAVPNGYFEAYYGKLVSHVQEVEGVLHKRKYTDYSRVIITLSALGKDARDVGGYNLLTPLGDYDQTIWQGLNGPIWALIALDSANYPMPQNQSAETQATRQMYIDCILAEELDEGGWTLSPPHLRGSRRPGYHGHGPPGSGEVSGPARGFGGHRSGACLHERQAGRPGRLLQSVGRVEFGERRTNAGGPVRAGDRLE